MTRLGYLTSVLLVHLLVSNFAEARGGNRPSPSPSPASACELPDPIGDLEDRIRRRLEAEGYDLNTTRGQERLQQELTRFRVARARARAHLRQDQCGPNCKDCVPDPGLTATATTGNAFVCRRCEIEMSSFSPAPITLVAQQTELRTSCGRFELGKQLTVSAEANTSMSTDFPNLADPYWEFSWELCVVDQHGNQSGCGTARSGRTQHLSVDSNIRFIAAVPESETVYLHAVPGRIVVSFGREPGSMILNNFRATVQVQD